MNRKELIDKMLDAYYGEGSGWRGNKLLDSIALMSSALNVAIDELLGEIRENEYYRSCSRCGNDAINNLLTARRSQYKTSSIDLAVEAILEIINSQPYSCFLEGQTTRTTAETFTAAVRRADEKAIK